jgi:hypothetical protein
MHDIIIIFNLGLNEKVRRYYSLNSEKGTFVVKYENFEHDIVLENVYRCGKAPSLCKVSLLRKD